MGWNCSDSRGTCIIRCHSIMNWLSRWRSGWGPLITMIHGTCGHSVLSHWQHSEWSEQTAVRKAYYPLLYLVLALICTCNSVPVVWVISTLKCTNWNKTELSRLTMVVTQVQNITITKRLVLVVKTSSCFGLFWFIDLFIYCLLEWIIQLPLEQFF